jgi:hypothetical protein
MRFSTKASCYGAPCLSLVSNFAPSQKSAAWWRCLNQATKILFCDWPVRARPDFILPPPALALLLPIPVRYPRLQLRLRAQNGCFHPLPSQPALPRAAPQLRDPSSGTTRAFPGSPSAPAWPQGVQDSRITGQGDSVAGRAFRLYGASYVETPPFQITDTFSHIIVVLSDSLAAAVSNSGE